ncbi:MAG: hypothetical protein JF609_05910 [Verrucomicrobia bacterium]|nr:hypothetical protein [Verrucomicrobiota bacterium]
MQDAFATQGSTPVLGVELRVLDVIGYARAVPQYAIVASAGSGGAISPAGSFNKGSGSSQAFTATPDATHFVSQWLLDSVLAQNGGSNYTLVNIQSNHNMQVTFLAKTNQTITFNPLPAKALGEPAFAVTATASSGLPVSLSIVSGPATIATATITLTNTGTVTVQATQAGNTNYNAAPSTNQSFTVYARPGVGLAMAGTNFILSWYTNVAGFGLYSSTNLTSNSWQLVNPAPVAVNGQYVVSNGISGAAKFYRLVK